MKLTIVSLMLGLIVSCSHSEEKKEVENKPVVVDQAKALNQAKQNRKEKQIDEYLDLGNRYATDGLYREAIESFKKALRVKKGNIEAHRMLGIIYVKVGRYRLAIKHLEFINDKIKSDFEANYYLAEAYRTQDRYGDAIFHYKVALSANRDSKVALKALAWSYYKIRYYRAALSTIRKLYKKDSSDVQVSIIMARVLNKMGYHKRALKGAKKQLVTADPAQAPYLKSVIGDIYYSMDDKDKAEESYRAALKDQPLLAGALLGLAKSLLEKGERVDIAISYLERAIRIKPGMVEALFYLGKAFEKSNPSSSKLYYQKFARRASGDPEYSHLLNQAKQAIGNAPTVQAHSILEDLESQL